MFGVSLNELWEKLPPIEQVRQALQAWDIAGEDLTDEEANNRFVRFAGVQFGVVPPEKWGTLRKQLLEFEARLASRQDDLGLVPDYPFTLTLALD